MSSQLAPSDLRHPLYPESRAGGYSRVDGSVEFYSRVNALLTRNSFVVELGAGRGAYAEDPVPYRRELRAFRGRVAQVIGLDVDPVVMDNPTVDEAHVLLEGRPFPLPNASVDLVFADWTFEHVHDSAHVASEIARVLRPGGWLCARTPNKWGYVGIAARAVPNRLHAHVLRRVQPTKQDRDTFPTVYRLNTRQALRRHFPTTDFEHCTYATDGDPRYFGSSKVACRAVQLVGHLTPPHSRSVLNVFLRKRG